MTLCINDHIEDMGEWELEKALSALPSWRREKALRYRHQEGQLQSALAYAELCHALTLSYGILERPDFLWNEHGKPTLKHHPTIHFSMSHCQVAVGCMVADRPCGFDIETMRSASDSLLEKTMNELERERILNAPSPAMEFTRLWTRKEAVFKLKGTGITDSLHTVLQEADEQGIQVQSLCNPFRGYVYSTAITTIH